MSENILEILRLNKLISSQTDNERSACKKEEVLKLMLVSIKDWIENYLKMKNYPVNVLDSNHVMLITSGSYALGLSDCESDLDLVCLASKVIDRNDFFDTIKDSIQSQLEVKNFQALKLNRCPLIKMMANNVKIDLTLAILNEMKLNEDVEFTGDDDDDDLLSGMEDLDVLSINGPRNMMFIKHFVPDLDFHRNILTSVKLWAKRRLIYSHSIGYLGGGAWSVMVAYICHQYHCFTQLMMLKKFFEIFSEWSWPNPVQLKGLSNKESNYHPWNPKDDYHHLMPIILPCFPETNCAFNVNSLTRSAIIGELKRGSSILHNIHEMNSLEFLKLFEVFNFYGNFKIFLVIIFQSQNDENHSRWSGLVESRMRFLLNDLSKMSSIKSLRVNPNQFLYHSGDDNHLLTKWYIGLEVAKEGGYARLDLSKEIEKLKSLVYNSAKEYSLEKGKNELEVVNVIKAKRDHNGESVKGYLPERYKHFVCSS